MECKTTTAWVFISCTDGVRDAKTAQQVSSISDAVVIGSRIVQEIENSNDIDLIGNIKNLIVEMRNSIDKDGVNEK